MEEMNTIEMQAQESAAGTAGYAESTAPAGPEAPQGDLGGADNEGTGARRQTPEENARFAAMRRRQEAQQREERLFHELVGDARNPETGMPFASKAEFVAWRDGAAGRGRAQAAPVEPEALARLEAQLRQQFRATDPEFLAQAAELKKAHDREAQAQFSNDLKTVPFPVSWTVKMKKKQKETQDILSYHTQAAGCSDKARAKASGGRQPIEECGRTGL